MSWEILMAVLVIALLATLVAVVVQTKIDDPEEVEHVEPIVAQAAPDQAIFEPIEQPITDQQQLDPAAVIVGVAAADQMVTQQPKYDDFAPVPDDSTPIAVADALAGTAVEQESAAPQAQVPMDELDQPVVAAAIAGGLASQDSGTKEVSRESIVDPVPAVVETAPEVVAFIPETYPIEVPEPDAPETPTIEVEPITEQMDTVDTAPLAEQVAVVGTVEPVVESTAPELIEAVAVAETELLDNPVPDASEMPTAEVEPITEQMDAVDPAPLADQAAFVGTVEPVVESTEPELIEAVAVAEPEPVQNPVPDPLETPADDIESIADPEDIPESEPFARDETIVETIEAEPESSEPVSFKDAEFAASEFEPIMSAVPDAPDTAIPESAPNVDPELIGEPTVGSAPESDEPVIAMVETAEAVADPAEPDSSETVDHAASAVEDASTSPAFNSQTATAELFAPAETSVRWRCESGIRFKRRFRFIRK